jgi:hypothetical protein
MVQVKGKTEGKKIFCPLDTTLVSPDVLDQYRLFSTALDRYYQGDWIFAREAFNKCGLSLCSVFTDRIGSSDRAPEGWRGIWTMTTK